MDKYRARQLGQTEAAKDTPLQEALTWFNARIVRDLPPARRRVLSHAFEKGYAEKRDKLSKEGVLK